MTSSTVATSRLPLIGLLAAGLVSKAGNAITMVAVPLYVLATTGSPLATGVAGVFATVPLIIGGALGGAVIDRFGYRSASILADLASGATVLLIPVFALTGGLPFWLLLLLVFLSGLLDTPGDTAKTVLLPELAERGGVALARAAGAQSAVQRTASMLGAATAGILVALVGATNSLFVNAVTFAVSALLVVVCIPRDVARPLRVENEPYLKELADGIRFLVKQPLLRSVVLLVMLTNAIDVAGLTVLKPIYAAGNSESGALLGFMVGCFAGGALAGSALFAVWGHRLAGRAMFVWSFFFAGMPPYLAMFLGMPVPVLLVVFALSGLAAGAINPMLSTAMYGLTPEPMRARVFGVTTAGVAAAMPLGSFAAGAAVAAIGLGPTLLGCAVLYAVLTLTPLFGSRWEGLDAARGQAVPV
ncbi:MFS transporter [Mycetocola manganoxydans]|uniref:Multidrug efflux pump Tap n=1 Tax=Mycetocola manganoxydans TaxID=699879 RepID=A0A3L6ZZT7_9MICO|nr:MFS transporter [Mycetocola manganoxydans]RLP73469.1 MFS transporter [Mycetocola manganoxydans]GHD41576.1 MFS transporter [Mycetocola manganoxydans]